MAHRVDEGRGGAAVLALALIIAITASWWALALWPMSEQTPDWLARTRYVCFGATRRGLPDAGGWTLLIGQPVGMLVMLMAVWGGNLRAGVRGLMARVAGQLTLGIGAAVILAGLIGVTVRVREAIAEPFATTPAGGMAQQLTRISDVPARLALVNQRGDTTRLAQFEGRAVLVTFAFGHCETVCPLVVRAALDAAAEVARVAPERTPAVVVVSVDPWRDTPSRLGSLAGRWGMRGDQYMLSGAVDDVERTLNAWRIPRVRNTKTGDISHPALVYVIGPGGRITYVVPGTAEQIVAAVRAL